MNSRIKLIDVFRGAALIAMTIYHFAWDLEYASWILPATTLSPGWVLFARSIASSFLFLAGVSLVLAHGNGIKWRGFFKRLAMVAVAAALISLVTFYAVPNGFIFFGILHAIALFSLVGLLFVRLPWFLPALVAIAVYWVGQNLVNDVFSAQWLWWVGLATKPPVSTDYVPFFPWFSATLAGIATAKLSMRFGWLQVLSAVTLPNPIEKPLSFIGQHSLIYYLIHQPIMIGLIWVFTAIAGPPDRTAGFVQICTNQCLSHNDKKFCKPYCSCVAGSFNNMELLTPFLDGKLDITKNELVGKITKQCRARHGG